MVPMLELWLPILLSAIAVFVVSSIIHMFLGYHRNDLRQLPDQDAAMNALRPLNLPPGEYVMPYAGSMERMKDPDYVARRERGPVAMLTVWPTGTSGMGKSLFWWFVYALVISAYCAYLAGRTLVPAADYLAVFRIVGAVAFAGYVFALWQSSIWWHRPVATNIRNTIDGLIYALVTAGMFGWLWPAA